MPLSWLLPCPILPLNIAEKDGEEGDMSLHFAQNLEKWVGDGWKTTENRHGVLRGIMVAAHRGMEGKGSSKFQTRFAP